tara:strand:- start:813 stop:1028 length:216 start_codon:yes stop_codon:yes gene_type:complete
LGTIQLEAEKQEIKWFGLNGIRYLFMTKEQYEKEKTKRPVSGVALGLSVVAEINVNRAARNIGVRDKVKKN